MQGEYILLGIYLTMIIKCRASEYRNRSIGDATYQLDVIQIITSDASFYLAYMNIVINPRLQYINA